VPHEPPGKEETETENDKVGEIFGEGGEGLSFHGLLFSMRRATFWPSSIA